jgi:cardiolipin synthase
LQRNANGPADSFSVNYIVSMTATLQSIATTDGHVIEWHDTGAEFLGAELEAINHATKSVLLEHYIFRASPTGDQFRDALIEAARRGVQVVVMLDYVGAFGLSRDYFAGLNALGGRVIWFNPVHWRLWIFRNHRKLLVVDHAKAFVGGCNIAPEYDGDGVKHGWRDGGISISGPVVEHLVDAFRNQESNAASWRWTRLRHPRGWIKAGNDVSLLLTRPGIRRSPLHLALRGDLNHAQRVDITMAYFLPEGRLKRMLLRAARHALRFRLLLPGKSDVPIMRLATQALYRAFQVRGAQVYEYQPQVLHAKVMTIDDVVYVGSANLDPRSLSINFEIMLRIRSPELVQKATATFSRDLSHSELVPRQSWRKAGGWWQNLKQRAARAFFTRLDLGIAQSLVEKREKRGITSQGGRSD